MVEPVMVPSIGLIDLFKNYSYSIGPGAKKKLYKNLNLNVELKQFPNL